MLHPFPSRKRRKEKRKNPKPPSLRAENAINYNQNYQLSRKSRGTSITKGGLLQKKKTHNRTPELFPTQSTKKETRKQEFKNRMSQRSRKKAAPRFDV